MNLQPQKSWQLVCRRHNRQRSKVKTTGRIRRQNYDSCLELLMHGFLDALLEESSDLLLGSHFIHQARAHVRYSPFAVD